MIQTGRISIILLFGILACAGCKDRNRESPSAAGLTVWFHSGQQSEREAIERLVDEFNAREGVLPVALTMIPEGSYNDQVAAAAAAGDLPDLLELDGPFLYSYAWRGLLRPLDELLAKDVRDDMLESLIDQGTFRGALYTVGMFDSGLGLYGRRIPLEAAGVRIPTSVSDAWSVEEFAQVLKALAERDPDQAVLDLKLNYRGEWFSYAFSPPIQSAGGDLIDRDGYQTAEGKLNGPESVAALTAIQSWITSGRVDPNVDDAAFTEGRVALSWSGHWDYGRYREAAGDDLVLLPLPDFGTGSRTGQGSWCWGIAQSCQRPRAAAQFLEYLLQPDNLLAMTNANGAVPARVSAVNQSERFQEHGPLRLFVDELRGEASVPRPKTPAYPVISSTFQEAFAEIRDGGDVQFALDDAVRTIDQAIRDNRGYPSR